MPDKKRVRLLAEPAIQVVLAWAGLVLLGWPLIQIAGERGTTALFVYVFVVWALLIVLIVLVSRSLRANFGTSPAKGTGGAPR